MNPATIPYQPSRTDHGLVGSCWKNLKRLGIAGIFLGAMAWPLAAAESLPGALRTIHDYRTGQPLQQAVADGTVYEFRATVPHVNFWKTPAPLDGLWIESTDKKTLLWLSSTSGTDATVAGPCVLPTGGGGGSTTNCPPANLICNGGTYSFPDVCCGGTTITPPTGCCNNTPLVAGQVCCGGTTPTATANCCKGKVLEAGQVCCDGTPTATPTVTISGPANAVVLCSGSNPTIQLTANGQPSGGSYSWAITAGGAKIATDSGLLSATVTLHGTTPSDTRNDVMLQVAYTKCGTTVNATQTLTVQKPSSISDTGSATVPISSGGTNGYLTAYLFQVKDQLVPSKNIQAVMFVEEYRILKCTTDSIPVANINHNTDANGRFADLLTVGFASPIPIGFQAQVDQTITVGGCSLDASGARCQRYSTNSAQSVQGSCPGGCP